MEIIWKDVIGYESLYQVSSIGEVRSKDRFVRGKNETLRFLSGKFLLPIIGTNGYPQVKLYSNNIGTHKKVHVLMAQSFYGYKNDIRLSVVNHIDKDKLNNRLDNLEIVTQRYNVSHAKDKAQTTSKYTGVSYRANRKAWIPSIKINGKNKKLGYCKSEYEAHLLYQKALLQL